MLYDGVTNTYFIIMMDHNQPSTLCGLIITSFCMSSDYAHISCTVLYTDGGKVREEGDGECEGERGEEGEGERGDSDKSDEEDVCPICLNELDEGEDLIACRRCGNRLHQHCMDICEENSSH